MTNVPERHAFTISVINVFMSQRLWESLNSYIVPSAIDKSVRSEKNTALCQYVYDTYLVRMSHA